MVNNLDLPKNWKWVALDDVGIAVSGGTPSTYDPEFWDGEIAWITPADLSNFRKIYISRGKRNISTLGLQYSSASLLPPNSILFSSRAPIGYVAIAKNELTTNQGFKNLILPSFINSKFVYYYFLTIKDLAESLASGTTFLELSLSKFKKIPFPLAPMEDQNRIANKLDELFSEYEKLEESMEKESNNLTMLLKLYEAKHFAFKEKPKLPLSEIIYLSSGKYLSSKDRNNQGKYFVYGGNGIMGKHDEFLYEKEELIIGRVGENCGNVHLTKPKSWITDNAFVITFKNDVNINFFKYYFKHLNLRLLAKSSSQPVISTSSIYKIKIFVPPIKEQNNIVSMFEEQIQGVENLKDQLSQEQKRIAVLKKKNLKEAFEGKLFIESTSDNSVSDLLEKIKDENERYIQDKLFSNNKTHKIKRAEADLYKIIKTKFFNNPFSYSEINSAARIEKNKLRSEFNKLLKEKTLVKFFEKNSGSIKYKLP